MPIFTVFKKLNYNFFKTWPISLKLCQTLCLDLSDGSIMSKKGGEI